MTKIFGTVILTGLWLPWAAGVAGGQEAEARAPEFVARDLDGNTHRLTAHQGQVVVLHFWATWCPYCRGEIPKLKTIHQRWESHGVSILAISVDEDVSMLARFVREQQLPYPVIAETHGQPLSDRYRVSGLPTTYLISRTGVVIRRIEGSADLVGAVRQALEPHPERVHRGADSFK